MLNIFQFVLPEKVADDVVQKYVKHIYDPSTKELVQVVMPFATNREVATLRMDKGWVPCSVAISGPNCWKPWDGGPSLDCTTLRAR